MESHDLLLSEHLQHNGQIRPSLIVIDEQKKSQIDQKVPVVDG
jgi:hypothetical protein